MMGPVGGMPGGPARIDGWLIETTTKTTSDESPEEDTHVAQA
jgi:hypothetical protein